MSGIIGTTGSKSGAINNFNRTLLPAFKQAWGSHYLTSTGTLSTSLSVDGGTLTVLNTRDVFNNGGHWDASTGKFTCPVSGIYYLGIYAMRSGAQGTLFDIRIIKNETTASGSTWGRQYDHYDSNHESRGFTMISQANAGDYFCWHNESTTTSFYQDDTYTFGFLIS